MLIYEGNLHKKIGAISQLGAEKITFPPKPDGHTYSQTNRRTDICFYRVALLLKNCTLQNSAALAVKRVHIKIRYRAKISTIRLNAAYFNSI